MAGVEPAEFIHSAPLIESSYPGHSPPSCFFESLRGPLSPHSGKDPNRDLFGHVYYIPVWSILILRHGFLICIPDRHIIALMSCILPLPSEDITARSTTCESCSGVFIMIAGADVMFLGRFTPTPPDPGKNSTIFPMYNDSIVFMRFNNAASGLLVC